MDPIQVLRGGAGRLIVRLPFTPERLEKIRTLPGRLWHSQERYWSLPDTPDMPALLLSLFRGETVDMEPELRPPLRERIRAAARTRGLSKSTARVYAIWARRFLAESGERPEAAGPFLAGLSSRSASTQNQALHALVFLFEEVLGQPLTGVCRAKMPHRVPAVLSQSEVQSLLTGMSGAPRLMATLLYGSGLRLRECCALRVKDIDFAENRIHVQGRDTPLPGSIQAPLQRHLVEVERRHRTDMADGFAGAAAPDTEASRQWGWQWVFPGQGQSPQPGSGLLTRHHVSPTVLQRAVREARLRAGLLKPASCQTLRQSFAAHLLEDGYDVRTVQEFMGHRVVDSTLAYIPAVCRGVTSPLDSGGKIIRPEGGNYTARKAG